ncbi:MAG: helix-turn-helix domain-containing protein [Bacillota bacterium]|nr:helix-turn-helix domain-containing protein [Bacillota bacterium]
MKGAMGAAARDPGGGGERYLRVRDVARMLDLSEMTVYRLVWSGRLAAVRVPGMRALRIPASAVLAMLDGAAGGGAAE